MPEKNNVQLTDIATPHDHDVLCGRGNGANFHAGNEHFRSLVKKYKIAYVACPKVQKPQYSRLIVDEIRSMSPPGRFLKQDAKTGKWCDIGDKKALDKTRQALREGAPELMKELANDEDEEYMPPAAGADVSGMGHLGMGYAQNMPYTDPLTTLHAQQQLLAQQMAVADQSGMGTSSMGNMSILAQEQRVNALAQRVLANAQAGNGASPQSLSAQQHLDGLLGLDGGLGGGTGGDGMDGAGGGGGAAETLRQLQAEQQRLQKELLHQPASISDPHQAALLAEQHRVLNSFSAEHYEPNPIVSRSSSNHHDQHPHQPKINGTRTRSDEDDDNSHPAREKEKRPRENYDQAENPISVEVPIEEAPRNMQPNGERPQVERSDSFTFDDLKKEAPAKRNVSGHQSSGNMSFSLGDLCNESNLSAVFEDSLSLTEGKKSADKPANGVGGGSASGGASVGSSSIPECGVTNGRAPEGREYLGVAEHRASRDGKAMAASLNTFNMSTDMSLTNSEAADLQLFQMSYRSDDQAQT